MYESFSARAQIEGDVIAYVSVSCEFALNLGVIFQSVVISFFVRSLQMSGKFSDLNSDGTLFEFLTEICVISVSFSRQISVCLVYTTTN
jgi:hypothetical protein